MSTIAITNVHVFEGTKLSELKTIVIENGLISSGLIGETVVDGEGGTLLPGFIDSHIHLSGKGDLEQSAYFGVTTMLDMATSSPALVDSLRGLPGLADIRSCYYPASAPGSIQTTRLGFSEDSIVTSPEDAQRFVAQQVAFGADYIKMALEDPAVMGTAALTPEIVAAIVKAAHRANKLTFAHVTSIAAFKIAVDASVDVLAHAPLEGPLPESLVEAIAKKGLAIVPTMVMLQRVVKANGNMPSHRVLDFHGVEITVQELKKAGVPIIAGTDANSAPGSWFKLDQGISLHNEFELLVAAGMTPSEVLQSATSVPAKYFNYQDRGVIEPGKRADLVLVKGDPTVDIKATRDIQGVWIAGVRAR